ncbi:MAG: hypothetical protein NZ893_02625 [Candidatus Aenigmarchaeota archaeon]|nr:hypothetical protein [Candidatus Aenigmarchaeota archaeon]
MKLVCPNCLQENEFQNFSSLYTCSFCGLKFSNEEWFKKTQEKMKEKPKEKKKTLELPAKISLTTQGSVMLRIFIPQNYLRKVMRLEALPKEKLPKKEKKIGGV